MLHHCAAAGRWLPLERWLHLGTLGCNVICWNAMSEMHGYARDVRWLKERGGGRRQRHLRYREDCRRDLRVVQRWLERDSCSRRQATTASYLRRERIVISHKVPHHRGRISEIKKESDPVDVELRCKYHDAYCASQVDFATPRLSYRKLSDPRFSPLIDP